MDRLKVFEGVTIPVTVSAKSLKTTGVIDPALKPLLNHDPLTTKSSRHPLKLELSVFAANKDSLADALRELATQIDIEGIGVSGVSAGAGYSWVFKYDEK